MHESPTGTAHRDDLGGEDTSSYVIAGGTSGRSRLRVLSSVMAGSTSWLLGRVGIAHDARVLDLGCGGGDVSRMIAEMAPDGLIVGVDFDPVVVALARSEADAAGFGHLRFLAGDVTHQSSDVIASIDALAPFDVVYARFLLSHLPDPAAVVDRMTGWCAVGGAVVCEDTDIAGSLAAPRCDAFESICALYADTVRARGGDAQYGLALPATLQRAGLSGGDVMAVQPGGLRGDAKRIQLITLERIAPTAIALGLTDARQVAELGASLADFVERNDTFVTTARVIQAWGRRLR